MDLSRSPFGRETFVQTGRLPMSRETTGSAYRWHNPQYFWSGDKFFRTFENGPWKWEAQQRYAGKNLNCGHYFAITPGGATAEARYYGLDVSNLQLLEIKGRAESVLDLTHEDNVLQIAKMAFKNFDDIPDEAFFMEMLSAMTDERGSGGNAFTDYIGYWAQNRGYDGVMFFGARALAVYPDIRDQIRSGKDDSFGQNVAYAFFERIRRTYDLINVVYFSTSAIIRKIQRYSFPATVDEFMRNSGSWVKNVFYESSEAEVDRLLTYNNEFQQQREARFTATRLTFFP